MAVYSYKPERVSAPVRAALILMTLAGVAAAVAALRASDALTRAYQWGYVALAYPVAWTLDLLARLRHGLHTGRLKSGGLEWSAWMGDVAARYPTVQRPPYRGPVLVEAAILAVALGVVAWRVGWFIYTRPRRLTPSGAHGTARWMTRREMKRLVYKGAPLLLGMRGGVSVAMNRGLQVLNTLVIGPIGSGKTSGFILTNLLREIGTRDLVITDLKLELLAKAYTHLAKHYDVWVLNFGSPETSMGYNPLSFCITPLMTQLWCRSWVKNCGGNEKEPIWDNWTIGVMMPAIYHLQAKDPTGETVTLAHLDEFLNGHSAEWAIGKLLTSPSPRARKAARGFMASLQKNDKLLGSVWSEISPKFMILSEPAVQAVTGRDEVKLARLGSGQSRPVALFLALDPDLLEELRPLTGGFFLDLFRTLGATARATPGGELRRDVFIYGDEWGNIGFVPGLKKALNMLRSAGVYGVYVFQMTAQAVETYGELGWTQLKGAFNTTIALSNMVPDDAKWFSESVLGEATEVTQGRNVQRDRFRVLTDRGGQSQSETKRALLTPDEVMNLREDELLVKMPQRPPARLTQRRYFDDHEVKRRAPAKGVSWIPPLGPPRTDGPLELPALDDLTDDAGDEAEAAQTGTKAATQQAATPEGGPALDEAAAFVDELGQYDEAEAFEASVSGR
jgi:type IV secretion system protein VirD4